MQDKGKSEGTHHPPHNYDNGRDTLVKYHYHTKHRWLPPIKTYTGE